MFYRKGQDLDSSVLNFVSWVLLVSTAKKEPANQKMIVNEYVSTDKLMNIRQHTCTNTGRTWTVTGAKAESNLDRAA